jgi:peptidoglycan/LPS O-acetylase OafA/YrhL
MNVATTKEEYVGRPECENSTDDVIAATSPTREFATVTHGRMEWLDALRGIAALTVVVGHCCGRLWPGVDRFYGETFHIGHAAVIAFFAISGYIIPVSIERASSLRVFWIRRFWRLYPAYWVTLAATLALVAVSKSYPNQGQVTFRMLPLDVGMLRGAVDIPVVAVAWSLWVELVFYALASLVWFAGLNRRPATVAWGLLLLSFCLRRVIPNSVWLGGWYGTWQLFLYLAIMAVGTCLYRLDRGELRPVFAYGALLGLLVFVARLNLATPTDAHMPALIAGLAAFLVARGLQRLEISPTLVWLGRVSYSLYLVHPLIINGLTFVGPRFVTLSVWVAASMALAAVSYSYIEAPGERLGRHLTTRNAFRTASGFSRHTVAADGL